MSIDRRVTESGAVRWDVRLRRPNGKAYKRTFRTKKEAERFEATEVADRARGTWVDPQAGRITLEEWADEWFESNRHTWRRATVERNRIALFTHWVAQLGYSELAAVSPRQVQGVVNGLVAKYKPVTVRGYYGTFRTMLGDAVDMDVIGRSPCRGIKLPPALSDEKRVISPADLHRLADEIGPRWRSMIYLAGVMGLRFGEVAALQLGDLGQDLHQIRIVRAVSEISGVVEAGPPKPGCTVR